MENALMGLPDFARGEAAHPAKQTTFKPLFDGSRKLEMMSNIVVETPIAEQPIHGANVQGVESNGTLLPGAPQRNQATKVTFAEHQDIIDELKMRGEEEIKALEEKHKNQVLQQVETFKSKLFDDISSQLEDRVSRALAPLVENCVSRHTVEAIVKEIRSIAAKDTLKSLQLSGPLELTSAVRQKLLDSRLKIEVEEGDDVELVVCLDDKLISTRLKEWSSRIEGAIL